MKDKLEELVFGLKLSSSPVLAFYFLSSDVKNRSLLHDTNYLLSEGFESEVRPIDDQITYLIIRVRESRFQSWGAIQDTFELLQDLVSAKIHKVELISGRFTALPH